jgi:ubiquinone/menaquinone biosynthesis C-methylase UbiE
MSQYKKPYGFFGRILARSMAWSHRDFYKNTSKVLNLTKDDTYLEIGFGSGLFIKKYVSNVSKIAGLDHSGDMVKLANKINRKLVNRGKAEFKQGDVSSLPWADNEFSIVVIIETFFFLSEPEQLLKEIYRVLKPGGRVVIEMSYSKDDGVDHTKHIKKMNLRLYNGEEMKKLLKESGFTDIVIHYFKSIWFPGKGDAVTKGMVVVAIKKYFFQ